MKNLTREQGIGAWTSFTFWISLACCFTVNMSTNNRLRAQQSQKEAQTEHLTAVDKEVYDAVLSYLRHDKPGSVRSLFDHGYLAENAEYYGFGPDRVSKAVGARLGAEIQADIQRRCRGPVSLHGYTPDRFRLLSDVDLAALQERRDSDAKWHGVIVWFSLPGYSHDKKAAHVDFRFDDGGRHGGGIGCCVVDRRKDRWRGRWKVLLFRG